MINYEMFKEKPMTVQEERAEYGKEKPKAKDTARFTLNSSIFTFIYK